MSIFFSFTLQYGIFFFYHEVSKKDIITNKSFFFTKSRLCPLLNGTMAADKGAAEHGGFGSYTG